MAEIEAPSPRRRASAEVLAQSLRYRIGNGAAAAFCAPMAMLLSRYLRFDAADPLWPDRDRLLAGQGLAELARHAAGLLGDGVANEFFTSAPEPVGAAVGAALAERILASRFGRSLVDHRCWVLADAARLATGAVQEAAGLAGLWRLGRLTVIACDAGAADAAPPLGAAGFTGFGWTVRRVAGGDGAGLDGALSAALRSFKPTLILYRSNLGDEAAAAAREPEEAEIWRVAGQRGAVTRRSWLKRMARHASRTDFGGALAGRLGAGWHGRLSDPPWLPGAGHAPSTAQSVRLALADTLASIPALTTIAGSSPWPSQPGVAEAAGSGAGGLALGGSAALAGVALHGGVLPIAAYPGEDAELIRPALGHAAKRGLHMVACVIEPPGGLQAATLAGLRATPNLLVLRPADATESLECFEFALRHVAGPSAMLLSEQAAPLLAERPARTRAARGGYLVVAPPGPRAATLLASGPELHVALAARTLLQASGLAVAVASLPCWSLFAAQDADWRTQVLGTAPLIGLEASYGWGWERWLGQGLFISLSPGSIDTTATLASLATMIALTVGRHLRK